MAGEGVGSPGLTRWGITLPLRGLSLAEHSSFLSELVQRGYSDAWSQEVAGTDAFTPLAVAAASSPELRLGTAIAAVTTRGPALLAMSAAALAEAAPGRFVLGIGASSDTIVSDWNGMPFDRPFTRVRDSLRFLRKALAGERIDEEFESFSCRGFQLERLPATPPPIHLAALGERMLALARDEADGVLLSLVTPDEAGRIGESFRARGKEVVLRIGVIVNEDAIAAREIARRTIAAYFNVPVYRRFREALDTRETLAGMWRAWKAGDHVAARAAIPDELIDGLFVHGSYEACREKLRRFAAAGVTTPIIAVMASKDDPRAAALELAPERG